MAPYICLLLNETAAFATLVLIFPGFFPPRDGIEAFMFVLIMIPMSLVWPIYVAVAPFAFLILYLMGELSWSDYSDAWPWRHFKEQRR